MSHDVMVLVLPLQLLQNILPLREHALDRALQDKAELFAVL